MWQPKVRLADQQFCNQTTNPSLDQENLEPAQIKEEQEEFCPPQEEEHFVLKLEADPFTRNYEESVHTETDIQDQKGARHGVSPRNAKLKLKKGHCKSRGFRKSRGFHKTIHSVFKCETCGKCFKFRSKFNIHLRVHTGEKPYSCDICGKRFCQMSGLTAHIRLHTGEKPYSCDMCRKDFRFVSELKRHMKKHTDENRCRSTELSTGSLPG